MRAAALLFVLLGGCAGLDPPASPPLTRNEARGLPPERLARRVFGDLSGSLLPFPVPPADRWPYNTVLTELAFLTPPRFAGEPGLCETDVLIVRLEPVGPLDGADTPVRPRRIELTTEFIARDLVAVALGGEVSERDAERDQAGCARLDPRPAVRISAQNAASAARGMRLASLFVRAAREGRALAPLACSLDGSGEASPEARCLADVAAMRIEEVNRIGWCNDPAFPIGECWAVQNWVTQLRIWVRPGSEDPIRAEVEGVIIVT